MADVFISYKREDRATAEQLAGALEQLGFDVWWDFALLSGDQYRKVIREVINQCKAAIVLWSTKAVDSEFVMDEAAHAKSQGKLCPVRIDGVELPFGFGQTHTDDLRSWSGEMSHHGFSSLLRALEAKTEKKARLGARSRDASGERAAAELEAFKAAQIASTQDALQAFLRKHPAGVFSDFVRSQLGHTAPPPPRPQPAPEPASFASTASSRPMEKQKASPWPVIAFLAILVAGGAAGFTIWQGSLRTAEADPAPASSTVTPRDVDAEIEAARAEERSRADDTAFAQAQQADTVAAYDAYLAAYAAGLHAGDAKAARSAALTRETAASARNAADASGREQAARDAADDSAYAVARSANTIAAYDAYLRTYPAGRNASSARSAKSSLSTPPPAASYAAYDLSQLNTNVRTAAEQARAARAKAETTAARGREAAVSAEDAARRGRNKEEGYTTFSNANGYRYEGGSTPSGQNGHGVSNWADGDKYAGQYKDGVAVGVGVFTYGAAEPSNVVRYEGELANNQNYGLGITVWKSGERHMGNVVNGSRAGAGVTEQSGERYEGEYAGNQRSGFGVEWDKDGKVKRAGIWANGALTSPLSR